MVTVEASAAAARPHVSGRRLLRNVSQVGLLPNALTLIREVVCHGLQLVLGSIQRPKISRFFSDAHIAHRVLGIALTRRMHSASDSGSIPMAGVPVDSVNAHVAKFVAAGYSPCP